MRLGQLFALLGMLAGEFPLTGQISHFSFPNEFGPRTVGFRTILQYDYSRTYRTTVDVTGKPYRGELARPIETLIWYPAVKSAAAKPLKYGDYFSLFGTEEYFSPDSAESNRILNERRKHFDANPDAAMHAIRDAKEVSGKFPLVVYAPSFSAPAFENADLCEYLASYGYVVIASPDMGAHARGMTGDLVGIDAQAHDITFLIGFARILPQVDLSHLAVAGFSWGGISNLFAAARDSRIDALVSLDGSARYFPKLIEDSKYVLPQNITVPLLFFTQGEITLESLNENKFDTSGNALNQMRNSDVYIVRMHGMRHGDYSSLFQRSPDYWKRSPAGDYSEEEAAQSYGWMARYALKFLDATLKSDANALAFLSNAPAKNGVPPHLLSLDIRKHKGFPPDIEGLASELQKRGFNHAPEVYAQAKAANPDMKLGQDDIDSWGSQLIDQSDPAEAIEIMKLNLSLHPDSDDALESLGEAYEANGDRALAVENYEKALTKNQENRQAKARLEALREKSVTN
jgi:dienelactone hydrolase